jgi:transposase
MPQPSRPANAGLRVLGADVAKDTIVFHDSLTGRCWTVANAAEALRQALRAYADYDWLVCETTGGYERLLLETAAAIGLTACRADAAQVKAFIASHGGRAKTDRIDAAWLTRYGLERAAQLKPWRVPAPEREDFAELLRHRQDLLVQRTQAKNRRSAPSGKRLHALLDEQIAFLSAQIGQIDAQMADLLQACPELARDEKTLRAIAGIGPVAARPAARTRTSRAQAGRQPRRSRAPPKRVRADPTAAPNERRTRRPAARPLHGRTQRRQSASTPQPRLPTAHRPRQTQAPGPRRHRS